MKRETVEYLTGLVRIEGQYGNPFRYLLGIWEARGRHLVDAANQNKPDTLGKADVEDLALGWDVHEEFRGEEPADPMNLWITLWITQRLRAVLHVDKDAVRLMREVIKEVTEGEARSQALYKTLVLAYHDACQTIQDEHQQALDDSGRG